MARQDGVDVHKQGMVGSPPFILHFSALLPHCFIRASLLHGHKPICTRLQCAQQP
jgi:hypothetical protein